MQAIEFEQGKLQTVNKPIPTIQDNEVLVRTSMAGICATDLELMSGMYAFQGVAGHEFVGIVAEAASSELAGKRVVGDINCACGSCSFCMQNNPRHCPNRSVIGIRSREGAFAEYVSVPRENLYFVPEDLSDTQAVFAEPLAAALRIGEQLHVQHQADIAVLGDGKLGLLIAFSLSLYAKNVCLLGHRHQNLDIAAHQGINVVNTAKEDFSQSAFWGGNKYDLVVEATGSPKGLDEALDLTRPQGTVVLKTTTSQASSLESSKIAVKELKIQGSRCGDISWALYNLQKGRIRVEPLIEAVYPFDNFEQAIQHAAQRGAKKILLDFVHS